MNILEQIAERKIQQALQTGFLMDNPYKGKKIQLEDLNHIPAELRAAYTILKNANVLPKEMQLKKEIYHIQQLLSAIPDDSPQIQEYKQKLTLKQLEFNILMEKQKIKLNPNNLNYLSKIKNKLKIG